MTDPAFAECTAHLERMSGKFVFGIKSKTPVTSLRMLAIPHDRVQSRVSLLPHTKFV